MIMNSSITWPKSLGIRRNVDLKPFVYYRIGGAAEYFYQANNVKELSAILQFCNDSDIAPQLIGEGSNILVGDNGISGLVIHNSASSISIIDDIIESESGVLMGRLAQWAANHSRSGLEFGVGIPGTVGGSIAGNAGCFGAEISTILVDADTWIDGEFKTYSKFDFEFSYRQSSLILRHPGAIILKARFDTQPSSEESIRANMQKLSKLRRDSQPANRSAGSIFRNPPNDFAGRLIDAAGLKGIKHGDAQISTQHANFIVNHGQATASDVMKLLDIARTQVESKFGIRLEPEIKFVGQGFGESP